MFRTVKQEVSDGETNRMVIRSGRRQAKKQSIMTLLLTFRSNSRLMSAADLNELDAARPIARLSRLLNFLGLPELTVWPQFR